MHESYAISYITLGRPSKLVRLRCWEGLIDLCVVIFVGTPPPFCKWHPFQGMIDPRYGFLLPLRCPVMLSVLTGMISRVV